MIVRLRRLRSGSRDCRRRAFQTKRISDWGSGSHLARKKKVNQLSELEFGIEEERRLDQETGDNELHRTGQTLEAIDTPVGKPQASTRRPRRYLALTGVAAMAVLLVAVLGTVIVLNQTPLRKSLLAPTLDTWSHHAAYDSKTPQEAFAANVQLTPCVNDTSSETGYGAPPQTTTVTWLDAGRDYGLALINVTCPHQPQPYKLWLFSLGRDDQRRWALQPGHIVGNRSADSPSTSIPPSEVDVPSWLLLPSDTYVGIRVPGPSGLNPPASVAAWYSLSHNVRTFVFGHVADPATRPVDATSVQVNGQAGWVAEQNGIVIVTLPLADGSTAFFAGTGTSSQVEDLAATAFAHMDDALPPLPR